MNVPFKKVFVLILALHLSGCAVGIIGAGVGSAAYVAVQENSLEQQAEDLRIKTNIKDQLIQRKVANIKNVEIDVLNSEVLLIGVVATEREKREIYQEALRTKGVKKVYDSLEVDKEYPFSEYAKDSVIANAIRSRMIVSSETYLSKITVKVFKGKVYLFGLVGNREEKAEAENIARTGKGVVRVYSFIRISNKTEPRPAKVIYN